MKEKLTNIICVILLSWIIMMVFSCTTVKKDCQGNKHYKQKGGYYL